MQLVELQDALAQLQVAVKQRNMLTDGFNQVIIDAGRDIVLCKGVFPAGWISALLCVEDVGFHLR